jgi:transcriptional antiterminator RfaH
MPLLPPEPFIYPDDLLTGDAADAAAGPSDLPRWWILHCKPRAEKALARRVLSRSVGFFLPQYLRQWRSRGRSFSSHLPLFPGYLFLHADEPARGMALETNLVASCLPVPDQAGLRADLGRVLRLMTLDLPLAPEEQLAPGDRVEIVAGPLAGLEGRLLRRGKGLRFTVEVRMLKQGVSVEVERWMFRPLAQRQPA